MTGCRSTGLRIFAQALLSPAFQAWFLMNGTPPFSTRSPSHDRIAGSTVSEPTKATATTRMVPVAKGLEGQGPRR